MGFGFLIARFALFLRAYGLERRGPRARARDFDAGSGSAWSVSALRLRDWRPCVTAAIFEPSRTASETRPRCRKSLVIAAVLALVGLAIAINILML